mmetsp:Transcript_7900/g.23360  ORF Transcript_7900/g.23360 Transcript_7900/m.23360 type:complete len:282 (+) Transcript_7900:267-1112(+)
MIEDLSADQKIGIERRGGRFPGFDGTSQPHQDRSGHVGEHGSRFGGRIDGVQQRIHRAEQRVFAVRTGSGGGGEQFGPDSSHFDEGVHGPTHLPLPERIHVGQSSGHSRVLFQIDRGPNDRMSSFPRYCLPQYLAVSHLFAALAALSALHLKRARHHIRIEHDGVRQKIRSEAHHESQIRHPPPIVLALLEEREFLVGDPPRGRGALHSVSHGVRFLLETNGVAPLVIDVELHGSVLHSYELIADVGCQLYGGVGSSSCSSCCCGRRGGTCRRSCRRRGCR